MQQIPTPKQRKASKQKKIAPLLTGNPGDFPLDQPLPSFHPPTELQIQDHNPTALNSSLLDIPEPPLLQSFLEPLDTLLNEDMDDSQNPSFIKKPLAEDAQSIQKAYSWNRRKCIREIINPNPTRCSIPMDNLFAHFNSSWSPPEDDSSPDFSSPPDLPPIAEHLSPELICKCLKSAENTAPGPDRISYKHWRELDPMGKLLSKIFTICLSLKKISSTWK
ncbi:retrovirus-related Pol polyprotein from type-2 retrotransposable element R2DM [Nephila pilipes]|uniref:Retrovirus-related Pol polyprotein from type-2 retrotransposable element R2DM n=1 Tax=Nephila pilipes TaxID=299642 RepID=A0A8X6TFE9_NEPPI|nr:retrovirus-related Pol polyprotein from type-2 retrotransposable element R2DM [Nephila pilipes]